jgi:hypothetical protein
MPRILDFVTGVIFLLCGAVMLWQIPGYQRRVEAGEIQRAASSPSFKTRRRAAIGILVVGLLLIAGWYFGLFHSD